MTGEPSEKPSERLRRHLTALQRLHRRMDPGEARDRLKQRIADVHQDYERQLEAERS